MGTESVDRLVNRIVRQTVTSFILFLYCVGIVLAILTALQGPHYYTKWGTEHSVFTYGSSVQYLLTALMALACFRISSYSRKNAVGAAHRPWVWLVVSAAFVFAALDEQFYLHERVGFAIEGSGEILDMGYFNHLDDLFMMVYAAGALAFSWFILRELQASPVSKRFYIIGLLLLAFAALQDFLPKRLVLAVVPRGLEELSEYFAGVSFAAAFLIYSAESFCLAFRAKLLLLTSGVAETERILGNASLVEQSQWGSLVEAPHRF